MKITDVEAIVLRRHDPVRDISDGTQDTLVVRIHTDAGLVGIGEVDSSPEVVKAAIEAPEVPPDLLPGSASSSSARTRATSAGCGRSATAARSTSAGASP